jgi:hypothetical protein
MCTALGLTSLNQVISNRKLRWAGHVRRMDWLRLPRKFLTSTHLAAEDGHSPPGTTSRASSSWSASTPTGRPCSSASRRAGGPQLKTERNGASSQLGYRWRLWKRFNPSPNKRRRNGRSLSTELCQESQETWQYPERQPAPGPRSRCRQLVVRRYRLRLRPRPRGYSGIVGGSLVIPLP